MILLIDFHIILKSKNKASTIKSILSIVFLIGLLTIYQNSYQIYTGLAIIIVVFSKRNRMKLK